MMQEDQNLSRKDQVQTDGNVNQIKELIFKYLHFSWLFILFLVISLTIAWLYIRYTHPKYMVSGTLLIRNEKGSMGGGSQGGENMFSDISLFQSSTNKQNEIQTINSRTMMERVVKALNLQTTYYAEGRVKTSYIYTGRPFELEILSIKDSTKGFSLTVQMTPTSSFTIGEAKEEYIFGQIIQMPFATIRLVPRVSNIKDLAHQKFILGWAPVQDAASSYKGGLSVKEVDGMSTVLVLSYITETPSLGANIINQLIVEYNTAAIEDKNEINRKILSFITDRLKLVESQLSDVEGELQRYKTSKQIIDLPAQAQLFFDNKSELDKKIYTHEIELRVVGLIEDYISQPKNKYTLVPSTLGLTDPILLELVTGYNSLASERINELQTGATLLSPVIRNLEDKIEEARLKILTNLANIKQSYRSAIESLSAQNKSINSQISSIPEKEQQGRERIRQQEIKQSLYLYLLQKREESEIAQASVIANSRVIDKALPTFNKISPVSNRIYAIAIFIGLLLPVLLIYIFDFLNNKVTTRTDIEKVTNTPILGEIGHSQSEKVLLFPHKAKGILAEQFRILRSNIRFLMTGAKKSNVILITSSFSGEGKSFISTNLGAAFAVSGKKTVILEFDLRKPKIVSGLKLAKSQGLTNFLVGAVKLEDLPQRVPEVEGLYVIPCGPVPPNPSELLLTPQIKEMFAWLRENFDLVVVDTAPIGLVSDAMNLSQYVDLSLYVIRQRYTFKRQLLFIEELYENSKLPNMGVLVNDVVNKGTRNYYGYGAGKYGYGYGYGYAQKNGYYEDEESSSWWKKLLRKAGLKK